CGRDQTGCAKTPGSAAAPTAGLHFTPAVFQALQEKGVAVASLSLNISIDTFRPLDALNPQNQKLHGERYDIPEETAKRIAEAGGRIIAVGTTSVRALESAAIGKRMVRPGPGETHLFISPGYRFQVVDSMITNFHMPRTSMLAMVSAFIGTQRLKKCYEIALQQGYRFLSFGDCMLILGRHSYAR
ncbi:MAG: S-adenosylmethionine:tRNA ribosyltransferase-isomerase, partial [Fimbriimonadales bacterium]|nr:S-adenosylmethionine:tRNA ribosyltransferase-isomerase [Fimbriimonadales bacterium]